MENNRYKKLSVEEFKHYFRLTGGEQTERESAKYLAERDFFATIYCKTEYAILLLKEYLSSMGLTIFKARGRKSFFKRNEVIEYDELTQNYCLSFQPYCEEKLFTFADFLERVRFDVNTIMTKSCDQVWITLSSENDQIVGSYIFKGNEFFGSSFVQTTFKNKAQMERSNYILNNLGEFDFEADSKLNVMLVLCEGIVAPSMQLKKISRNILLTAANLKTA